MNTHRNFWKLAILFVVLAIGVIACSEEEPTPTVAPEIQQQPAAVVETVTEVPPDVYQNTPWLWVSFNDTVEGIQEISEPDRYQVTLNDDGSVSVQADCNMVSGTYTVDGSSISIELGPSTMAACPEDSLGDQFVQYLSAAAIMFFDSGDMLFDLFADSGTMRFSQTGGGAPSVSQPSYRWGEVADRLWVLLGYGEASNPTVVEEGTVITAAFSSVEPTVSGSGGCNNYFTGYESTDGGDLSIDGPIGSTMMFCEDSMDAEAAYFAALETVSGWSLSEEGWLELSYDSGQPYDQKLIFAPGKAPLAGPTWMLVSYGEPDDLQSVEEGTSITAKFAPETDDGGVVGGNATCNSYTTSYTIDDDQISFGPIAGTLMMCPIGADQEQAYLAALETAKTYQIVGPNMQIAYDGGVLNYTSQNLPLENVLWQAVMVAGVPVAEEVEITALFYPGDEVGMGNVGGNAGCNNYNTSYETSEDLSTNPTTHFLTINSPMAMTMAFCPDEDLADLEQGYLAALESSETYEILGNQLVIHTAEGDILYSANREPLVGTLWSLISLGDIVDPQSPVEGSNFTAQFSRLPSLPTGTVTGETGCNNYNATYTSNLNKIKVNLPEKSNNEECPWGVGNFEVEQQYFLALSDATEYRILGDVLQILYGDGQALTFQATQSPVESVLDLTPLANTFWYLVSIGDNPLLPYTEITAGFDINEDGATGAISGSSGCNAYSAEIGVNFAIGPIATTQKACPHEVMEQEGGYLDWLSRAYSYVRAGDQLIISTGNGLLTYQSTPVLNQSHELQNVTWHLVSVGNLTAVEGSNATTLFSSDGQTVSGYTGCNDFNGSYSTRPGNTLTISGFATTRAACRSDDLTRQEEALLAFLPSAVSYLVNGNQMQIQTTDGSVINYTSIPPVQPTPPTAVINGPQGADIGQPVTYDGSGSVAGSTPIVHYEWDMGDGTILSGPTIQYAYNTASTFNVRLRVTDQAGLTGEATQGIQIYPVVEVTPPTAAIEGPSAAFVGEPVTFSAANSQQGTAEISGYQWRSGDGNNTGSYPENTFTTIYAKPGTYYPEVTVTDASGLSDSASMAITINAQPEGVDWFLSETIPGTSIDILFRNGNIQGFGGCNQYNAKYTATPADRLSGSISIGPISNSNRACTEEILAQEQTYLANLQSATSYLISGDSLTLTLMDGSQLVYYAAVATPAPAPVATQ